MYHAGVFHATLQTETIIKILPFRAGRADRHIIISCALIQG